MTFAAINFDAVVGVLDTLAKTDGLRPVEAALFPRRTWNGARRNRAFAVTGFMKFVAVLMAFAVLLLAAVALFAPATLLDARLNAATGGQLRLADATGSAWNGRGLVTNAQRTWSIPVGWKVDPLHDRARRCRNCSCSRPGR